jgi:NhaP-type Na+/H+ or K+/H+ antiporter
LVSTPRQSIPAEAEEVADVSNPLSAEPMLAIDNFDILMMVLSPIVSYLMAETFSISGMLALMVCAFLQSVYAQNNLEPDRSLLLTSAFEAISYTFRSICDILIGICFALHFNLFHDIGIWLLLLTMSMIYLTSYGTSYFILKRAQSTTLLKSDTESLILLFQNNTRGLLGLTLALQNFNTQISAIALLYIVASSLIAEPVMNYVLNRHLATCVASPDT